MKRGEHLHGTKIVRVGNEEVLLAFSEKLVKDAGVHESIIKISMAWGVPVGLVIIGAFRAGKERFLVDTGIAGLIEGSDAELLVGIFFDDAKGILVGIERSHENKGDINTMGGIEVLDLPDSEIKESHVVFDLERTLSAGHAWERNISGTKVKMQKRDTHGSTEATVDLEDGKFVEVVDIVSLGEIGIGDDLIGSRRLDTIPVAKGESKGEVIWER